VRPSCLVLVRWHLEGKQPVGHVQEALLKVRVCFGCRVEGLGFLAHLKTCRLAWPPVPGKDR
jgi:hypothetical protein